MRCRNRKKGDKERRNVARQKKRKKDKNTERYKEVHQRERRYTKRNK